jgi:signal transduction histidine kinase
MLSRQMDRDGVPDPTRLRKVLEAVDQQSIKLTALVSQLLDVSRLEAGRLTLEPRLTDVSSLVQEMVSRTQTTTVHHTLNAKIAPDIQAVVDPLRLEQVLTNLLDNAIKYSPDGGPINVDMSLEADNSIRIAVTDHGMGIPPEHRASIFEKFYQVQSSSVQGMGLGLFISREIILLHGGTIEAQFPPEGGTRFVITLPVNGATPTL